jgi:hypothetical protein
MEVGFGLINVSSTRIMIEKKGYALTNWFQW